MFNSEYRFPLFDSLLYGLMNPFLKENHSDCFLDDSRQDLAVEFTGNHGEYRFSFYQPINFKCSFYYHRLINETFWYCKDILKVLETENEPNTRAYLKLSILDKHLKTCLIKTGEIIHYHKFTSTLFLNPLPDTDSEMLSNSYIFHLLKVCLTKAYLEVQEALLDVIIQPLSEIMVYTALVNELPPVKCFLKKSNKKSEKQPQIANSQPEISDLKDDLNPEINSEVNSTGIIEKPNLYTIKDLVGMKLGSDRTIRRMLEKGDIVGFKTGKIWKIAHTDLDISLKTLKTKTSKNRIK